MFEVLAFVYDNYDTSAACPEPAHLLQKLAAVGFEADEIDDAIAWLRGLNVAAQTPTATISLAGKAPEPPQPWLLQPSAHSMRIYLGMEQIHLGTQALGFIRFLESSGMLTAHMREIVIDRAMAAPGAPVKLEALKLIVLMVYWSFGREPDALVLDELCDDTQGRVAH